MIAVVICFSGFMYWILERLNDDSDEQRLKDKPIGSIYLATMSFVGQNEFQPRTVAARIMAFSMAFWGVLVISAYTANLASFLVASKEEQLNIGSFAEAVKAQYTTCVRVGTITHTYIKQNFPQLILVEKNTASEAFDGMRLGHCKVVATEAATFSIHDRLKSSNKECRMFHDGRIQRASPAGFVTKVDIFNKCTSLLDRKFSLCGTMKDNS